MSKYKRTTRLTDFRQLRPELHAAIEQLAAKRAWGDVGAEAILCCETKNEQRKVGFLQGLKDRLSGPHDPDPVHYAAALVTPSRLIWAAAGEKRGTTALWAKLRDAEIEDYAQSPFATRIPDTGINVFGNISGFSERASAFIGLGDSPATEQFKQALEQAIASLAP